MYKTNFCGVLKYINILWIDIVGLFGLICLVLCYLLLLPALHP